LFCYISPFSSDYNAWLPDCFADARVRNDFHIRFFAFYNDWCFSIYYKIICKPASTIINIHFLDITNLLFSYYEYIDDCTRSTRLFASPSLNRQTIDALRRRDRSIFLTYSNSNMGPPRRSCVFFLFCFRRDQRGPTLFCIRK
jgi:hypothetical protein